MKKTIPSLKINKTILSMICMCLLLAVTVLASAVDSCPDCTYVAGEITQLDGTTSVPFANVSVNCKGNVLGTVADSVGIYWVVYNESQCNATDTATVTASKDGQSGTNSGTVHELITVNLAIVNVQIPEFGLAAGAVTLGIAGLGVLAMRRRY